MQSEVINDVRCYGELKNDSNIYIAGFYQDAVTGDELDDFEQLYCRDHGERTWAEVVANLQLWADAESAVIVELSTC